MTKEKNPDVAIMLGGAPVTQDVANLFGVDGYGESAGNAVSEGIKMIGRLQADGQTHGAGQGRRGENCRCFRVSGRFIKNEPYGTST